MLRYRETHALELIRLAVGIGLAIVLMGCVLSPAQRIENEARGYGFIREVVAGKGFNHIIFLNFTNQRTGALHVYLEGDGRPWISGQFVASDPTPKRPLMLRLMALDPASSIYLGRPCYHGLAYQSSCNPQFWTDGRYSQMVVDSMAVAVDRFAKREGVQSLILMGHSGGGTLAMLLAERLPKARAVVTVAGNLDPDAWTQYHGYSPLKTSLNPSRRARLNSAIYQLHLAGSRDQIIPLDMLQNAVAHQQQAEVRIISGFDHACCWQMIWPSILSLMSDSEFPFKSR